MLEMLNGTVSSFFTYFKSFFANSPKVKPLEGLLGLDRSEAIIHNLIVAQELPGLAITILKNGETHFQKGFGYADIENKIPVNPKETIFRIASISKCITGLAFGKMVEEGILDWDDSFYKHVPYYPKKKFDFTLRQLASHTAGIRVYRGKEFGLNLPYTIKESLQVFENDPLVFEPGKKTPIGFKKAMEVNNFYKLAGGGYLSTSEDIARLGQAILDKKLLRLETYKQLLSAQLINQKSTYYGLGFQVSEDNLGRNFVGHVGSSVGAYSNLFVYPKEEMVVSILINCTDSAFQDNLDKVILQA